MRARLARRQPAAAWRGPRPRARPAWLARRQLTTTAASWLRPLARRAWLAIAVSCAALAGTAFPGAASPVKPPPQAARTSAGSPPTATSRAAPTATPDGASDVQAAATSSAPAAAPGAPAAAPRAPAAAPGAPGAVAPSAVAPSVIAPSVIDALGAADALEVEHAVAAITALPAARSSPDLLFAAARACEDRLLDPGRAAAIYARIVSDHPGARVAIAAAHRRDALRALIGDRGQAAGPAAELARLVAHADDQPAAQVLRRAAWLSAIDWPGAPAAALWLADWLRRSERRVEAQAQYARVVARWPSAPQARAALRGGAGVALDARNWPLARALAIQLPLAEPADRDVRDDLVRLARRGRLRDLGYLASWIWLAVAGAGLLGALALAVRGAPPGRRRAALRPPIEVLFLAPIAAVLIGVAFTAHRAIAPAVATIASGGLALAYLSGTTLEQLRARGHARRRRSLAHVAVCLLGVAALAYIALTRDNLIDLLIETVRFGPDA